jgi:hypothetical protein
MGVHKPIISGDQFGRLTVLNQVPGRVNGWHYLFLCRCVCGNEKVFYGNNLNRGLSRSCGCLAQESRTTHGHTIGLTRSPTCSSWHSMLQRCLNPNCTQYQSWGGRGIKVCERWLKFENFLADMGERPPNTSIDRYPDHNGNYEPGNCRWATRREQGNNTRTNQFVTVNGVTLTYSEWARAAGISPQAFRKRVKAGWTGERLTSKRSPSSNYRPSVSA